MTGSPLSNLLQQQTTLSGRITSTTRSNAVVATRNGPISAAIMDGSLFRAGDNVLVVDGIIVGKTKCVEELPVYIV